MMLAVSGVVTICAIPVLVLQLVAWPLKFIVTKFVEVDKEYNLTDKEYTLSDMM